MGEAKCWAGQEVLSLDGVELIVEVGQADFGVFQECFGQLGLGDCQPVNMTGNGMIDLGDFVEFEAAITGP